MLPARKPRGCIPSSAVPQFNYAFSGGVNSPAKKPPLAQGDHRRISGSLRLPLADARPPNMKGKEINYSITDNKLFPKSMSARSTIRAVSNKTSITTFNSDSIPVPIPTSKTPYTNIESNSSHIHRAPTGGLAISPLGFSRIPHNPQPKLPDTSHYKKLAPPPLPQQFIHKLHSAPQSRLPSPPPLPLPFPASVAPSKLLRTITTTSFARATELLSEGGTAELAAIVLRDSVFEIDASTPTKKRKLQGLELSPEKVVKGKAGRFIRLV